eukprot:gene8114-16656_t
MEDLDEETEEILVYMEFSDFDNTEFLSSGISSISIQNLLEQSPSCIIDQYGFQGKHKINVGSQLFFDLSGTSSTKCIGSSIKKIEFSLNDIIKSNAELNATTVNDDVINESQSSEDNS